MKYFIITISAVMILGLNSAADAKPEVGKILVGIYGNTGAVLPGGRIDYPDREPGFSFGWGGGISIGYQMIDSGGLDVSCEYGNRPMRMVNKSDNSDWLELTSQFVDILFGWKGYLGYFYYEMGIYYGIGVGNWDLDNSNGTSADVSGSQEPGEFGVYAGLGISIDLGGSVEMFFGCHYKNGLTDSYDEQNASVSSRMISGKFGITLKL